MSSAVFPAGPEQMPECGRADVTERETRPRGRSKSLQGGQPNVRDETPAVEMPAVMGHGVSRIRDLAATRTADKVTHVVRSAWRGQRKRPEAAQIAGGRKLGPAAWRFSDHAGRLSPHGDRGQHQMVIQRDRAEECSIGLTCFPAQRPLGSDPSGGLQEMVELLLRHVGNGRFELVFNRASA